MKRPEKKLVLENGMEFYGVGFGADCRRVCEIVFNTSVVGYQEIISDPSYAEQIVVMTYPLIGNYGITDEDFESRTPFIGGLVVRECCDTPSNFRYTKTLEEELDEHGIPCLSGVDTRMLTKVIRDLGRPRAAIVEAEMPLDEALKLIASTPLATDLVSRVSCRKRWLSRTPSHLYNVVVVDCGIKNNVIRVLNERGCNVTIVPYCTPAEVIMAFNPDGIVFSNGPGSVSDAGVVSKLFTALRGRKPIFGIGLGFEIIAESYGARPGHLGCGFHGDHPVRDLSTGRINIAVLNQSYGYSSLEGTGLVPTHALVPENLVVGFRNDNDNIFAVQFLFESAPGPKDNVCLIDKFVKMMEDNCNA